MNRLKALKIKAFTTLLIKKALFYFLYKSMTYG